MIDSYLYCQKDYREVAKELATDLIYGLSQKEASQRLTKYGPNTLDQSETSPWRILLRQFQTSFIYLLLAAAVISFLLKENIDGWLILLFVTINALLGFIQEYRSERAMQILKKYTVAKSRVLREENLIEIPTAEIVPGDIVYIKAGDVIGADLRLFKLNNLNLDESVLTGEAEPKTKTAEATNKPVADIFTANNLAFSGTRAVSGEARGIVIASAKTTVIGKVAHLIGKTEKVSSFQEGLAGFSKSILRMAIFTIILVFLANFLLKGSTLNYAELAIFSIALAVSVIPEALPLVMTFSLSRGALKLAKNKVVVKRLSAIEDLGSIEVLCCDKTGTLTENKLTVDAIWGSSQDETLIYAALETAENRLQTLDPFDLAISEKLNLNQRQALKRFESLSQIPFDPERRRSSIMVKMGNKVLLVVKGAAEELIKLCQDVTSLQEKEMLDWIAARSRQGDRILAVGWKILEKTGTNYNIEDEKALNFSGLITFLDQIKDTAAPAVREAKNQGIRLKVLTGDSREVARTVAENIGLIQENELVITGQELSLLPEKERQQRIEDCSVFARISPEQKFTIIQHLKKRYQIGFLGEGVNDAPALKVATVGLVVDSAADIAREATDIVLLKKDLKVIVQGIKEGRAIFANTVKYIKITLASNFGNFYSVAIASLFINFLPMLPIQILLLNLLSDFPMISIAADNVDTRELAKPRRYDVKEVIRIAIIFGIISSLFDFLIFGLFYRSEKILQTNWFIASVLTELALLFCLRSFLPFFRAKRPAAIVIILAIFAAVMTLAIPFLERFGQQFFRFAPPKLQDLWLILAIVGLYFITSELAKNIYARFGRH